MESYKIYIDGYSEKFIPIATFYIREAENFYMLAESEDFKIKILCLLTGDKISVEEVFSDNDQHKRYAG